MFSRILEMSLAACLDTWLSLASGRVVVDVLFIDEKLHDRFGDYENRGLSMEELVRDKYGDEAVKLLNELI